MERLKDVIDYILQSGFAVCGRRCITGELLLHISKKVNEGVYWMDWRLSQQHLARVTDEQLLDTCKHKIQDLRAYIEQATPTLAREVNYAE